MKILYTCIGLIFTAFIVQKFTSPIFNEVKSPTELIVSLTSYPPRIKTVHRTIETILNQSMKADKVILWLAPEQFPNKENDLPKELLDLTNKGLTIDWYHDIRSYKKLIPALKKYPDATIVTADDDILYPDYWLVSLYDEYKNDKNTIWCHRAHQIKLDDNNSLAPYKKWNWTISKNSSDYLNFCTSGAGVLLPPHSFYHDILDEEKFMTLSTDTDDIWFWAMLVMNNKKMNVVSNKMRSLLQILGTQETSLSLKNVEGGNNDVSLQKVLKEYPEILKRLQKDDKFSFKSLFSHNK